MVHRPWWWDQSWVGGLCLVAVLVIVLNVTPWQPQEC